MAGDRGPAGIFSLCTKSRIHHDTGAAFIGEKHRKSHSGKSVDVGVSAGRSLQEFGFAVTLAYDAQDALGKLAGEPQEFDIVFSDVTMPGMGGIELGKAVKSVQQELPFVLPSGYSRLLVREGTFGFELLQKPYFWKTSPGPCERRRRGGRPSRRAQISVRPTDPNAPRKRRSAITASGGNTGSKTMSIKGEIKEAAGFVKEETNEHGKTAESQAKAQEGRDLRNEGRVEDGKAPKTTKPGTGHPEK